MLLFEKKRTNNPPTDISMIFESLNVIGALKGEFTAVIPQMECFISLASRTSEIKPGVNYSKESLRIYSEVNRLDSRTLGLTILSTSFEEFGEQESPLNADSNTQGVIASMWGQIKERAAAGWQWVKSKAGAFTHWLKMLFSFGDNIKKIDLITQRVSKADYPEEEKKKRLEYLSGIRAMAVEVDRLCKEYKSHCERAIDADKFEKVLGIVNMEPVTLINGDETGFYSTDDEAVWFKHQRIMELYIKLLAELASFGSGLETLNMVVIKLAHAAAGDFSKIEAIDKHLKGGDGAKAWIAHVGKSWTGISKLLNGAGVLISASNDKNTESFIKFYQSYTKELADVSIINAGIGAKLSELFND